MECWSNGQSSRYAPFIADAACIVYLLRMPDAWSREGAFHFFLRFARSPATSLSFIFFPFRPTMERRRPGMSISMMSPSSIRAMGPSLHRLRRDVADARAPGGARKPAVGDDGGVVKVRVRHQGLGGAQDLRHAAPPRPFVADDDRPTRVGSFP